MEEPIAKAKEKSEKVRGNSKVEEDAGRWSIVRKKKWLRDAFKLDSAPMLESEEQKEEVVELLLKYFACISVAGEFGQMTLLEHEIHTITKAKW